MYTGGDSAGKWNDDPSDGRVSNIKGYVCSYRYACAEGYMLEPKERKRCFRFVQSPQSWEGAESFCRADVPGKGSDLATIATETENAFVLSLIQGAPGWAHRSYSRPTWIGCNDLATASVFVWAGEGGRPLKCFEQGYYYTPDLRPDINKASAKACQAYCAGIAECAHFSFHADRTMCHVAGADAKREEDDATPSSWTSGPPHCYDAEHPDVYSNWATGYPRNSQFYYGSSHGCRMMDTDSTSTVAAYRYTASQYSAEDFSRLNALLCTATDWIFIPTHCFAVP